MPSTSDLAQVRHANATGRTPVVFIHDPWLLPSSWKRWADVFEEAGFASVLPAWPAGEAADHVADLIGGLERKPAVVGHGVGGLLTQIIAGRGLACAAVAISPSPSPAVLPPPMTPAVQARASGTAPLAYEQFRHSLANAVGEEEAGRLHEAFVVPAPGAPPLPAPATDLRPWGECDATAQHRGPLLLISGELDRIVPWAAAHAFYQRQARNEQHLTEIIELPGRGHSLTVDHGWREVCGTALTFIQRFVEP
ncbi:alpha/beta hydrolase [Nonomuraea sp. NPDC049637]|uniref:alpha/beta hydrolase n=1 Tax=Nonomuraea sp. NPDC049637 TaxID=3154356 RepID=UPI003438F22B